MRKWDPSLWAGFMPNGLGQVKPNHFGELFKAAWRNRDQLPFAWRILNRGVCDGCALGTTGMRDFTMSGIHLCTVRLELLRLNTMGALDHTLLADVSALKGRNSASLRALGRMPYPMVRRRREPGFKRVAWDEALDLIAGRVRATDPQRLAFYVTSRGITNEVYYVAQKVARFLGTNNVDNSSRVCHAPSTVGLKQTIGVSASTCSYSDWIGTDLLVFQGSDTPNNQPVTTKYMYAAKRAGTRIVVINPYREPGLERYWIPSIFESAVFGTRLADEFFQVHTGGDIAFLNGVLKHLIEQGWADEVFLAAHTTGWDQLKMALSAQPWEMLEASSGATREEMLRFARMYGSAKSTVFVWSMGITQHRFGVDNVKAIVNLALSRGMVGREKCGVMPIRGHSGVQGGAEVGCVPNQFPGGRDVNEASAQEFSELWGFPLPARPGLTAVQMIEAAHRGELDVLYSVGGNFLETLPEPEYVREALERVPVRVHQDIVLTSQMLLEPADTVVLLPAATRYESPGGGTATSTERRIYFSPEIPGRRVGEARPEWEIFMRLAERVRPELADLIHFPDAAAIRSEIARAVPFYQGIERLRKQGDVIQWGGPRLCEGGVFKMPDGKAALAVVRPPETQVPEGWFLLSTRRGKQFNSMVQAKKDPLNAARREDVLMNPEDVAALGLKAGDAVVVRSDVGEFRGRCKPVPMRRRNVQVHWPEGNALIRMGATDPLCGIPDYNAVVEILPAKVASGMTEPVAGGMP
ncbi:MAG: FdhF/YdeP family oxidoreductase [Dehalococcoidia bacterium]|nr:FdhF/YdeP family oxidoreductase [Dehalococcoidia bacterium]